MNKLAQITNNFEKKYQIKFRPTRNFFIMLGINQKRFSKILRNELQPNLTEIENLSKYFDCKPDELFEFSK